MIRAVLEAIGASSVCGWVLAGGWCGLVELAEWRTRWRARRVAVELERWLVDRGSGQPQP